jgi:tRNA nucleotidyltransferase (CCA-adding enzyme)
MMNTTPSQLVSRVQLSSMFDGLDVFAVGGAVRAIFTNQPVIDIDLMVRGVTPKEMVERGFRLIVGGNTPNSMSNTEFREQAVAAALDGRLMEYIQQFDGTGFPVFLDDEGREIALARKERSTGTGHREFTVIASPEVTVEEDLSRRDFTVNAMAVALTDTDEFAAGTVIDPFDGQQDVAQRIIRVVNENSFAEDPLRILRMARFAARLEFDVHPETLASARQHVGTPGFALREPSGLYSLPSERWGLEVLKAFTQAAQPSRFIRVLDSAQALSVVFPELVALKGVPAGPDEYHREGDAFDHTMLVMDEMAALRPGEPRAVFAALAHDLGKSLTPEAEWPSHPLHHKNGVALMSGIQSRLVLPTEFQGVMETAARHHMKMHEFNALKESTVLSLVDDLRDDYSVDNPGDEPVVRHIKLDELIDLAVADTRGREPSGEFDRESAEALFDRARRVLDGIGGAHVMETFDAPKGKQFGDLLRQERVRAMRDPDAFGV